MRSHEARGGRALRSPEEAFVQRNEQLNRSTGTLARFVGYMAVSRKYQEMGLPPAESFGATLGTVMVGERAARVTSAAVRRVRRRSDSSKK